MAVAATGAFTGRSTDRDRRFCRCGICLNCGGEVASIEGVHMRHALTTSGRVIGLHLKLWLLPIPIMGILFLLILAILDIIA